MLNKIKVMKVSMLFSVMTLAEWDLQMCSTYNLYKGLLTCFDQIYTKSYLQTYILAACYEVSTIMTVTAYVKKK